MVAPLYTQEMFTSRSKTSGMQTLISIVLHTHILYQGTCVVSETVYEGPGAFEIG
jgi:hypothetical protein